MRIAANLVSKVRPEKRNGRDFLVARAVLLVPGVLPGSEGPLTYTAEDTALAVNDWNGVPLVVYHPQKDGRYVSAKSPEWDWVGMVFNVKFTDKLEGECWFDVDALTKVDKRILEKLKAGEPIELSTGLFTANETVGGVTYARQHKPDHLAILPDQRGACGIADGCGVLVNAWSDAARQAAILARRATVSAAAASRKLGNMPQAWHDANKASERAEKLLARPKSAPKVAGSGAAGKLRAAAFSHSEMASVHRSKAAFGTDEERAAHAEAAVLHDQADLANFSAANYLERKGVQHSGEYTFSGKGVEGRHLLEASREAHAASEHTSTLPGHYTPASKSAYASSQAAMQAAAEGDIGQAAKEHELAADLHDRAATTETFVLSRPLVVEHHKKAATLHRVAAALHHDRGQDMIGNTWSDAAREAAKLARRASKKAEEGSNVLGFGTGYPTDHADAARYHVAMQIAHQEEDQGEGADEHYRVSQLHNEAEHHNKRAKAFAEAKEYSGADAEGKNVHEASSEAFEATHSKEANSVSDNERAYAEAAHDASSRGDHASAAREHRAAAMHHESSADVWSRTDEHMTEQETHKRKKYAEHHRKAAALHKVAAALHSDREQDMIGNVWSDAARKAAALARQASAKAHAASKAAGHTSTHIPRSDEPAAHQIAADAKIHDQEAEHHDKMDAKSESMSESMAHGDAAHAHRQAAKAQRALLKHTGHDEWEYDDHPGRRGLMGNRKETIDWLVVNCTCWKDGRAALETLPDAKLAQLKASAERAQAVVNSNSEIGKLAAALGVTVDPAVDPNGFAEGLTAAVRAKLDLKPVTNAAAFSSEQWLALAPPEVHELLAEAKVTRERHRAELVGRLTANMAEPHRTQAAQLYAGMKLEHLRVLAAAAPPVVNFSGAAGGAYLDEPIQQPAAEEFVLNPFGIN